MEQRSKYTTQGVCSEFVGELQQDIETMTNIRKGLVQLLFISPESLLSNPQWREMLLLPVYQLPPSVHVIQLLGLPVIIIVHGGACENQCISSQKEHSLCSSS